MDEPGFWCSDALIDSERLAQVPGGLGIIVGKLTAAEAGQRPVFLRRCAQLDRLGQRLAVNLAGLLGYRRTGSQLGAVVEGDDLAVRRAQVAMQLQGLLKASGGR